MNALARDTGGRAVFNTNALDIGLSKALKETSVYYLLAWRPDHPVQATGKFRRISVTIPSRSDLTVRVRQGFFDPQPATLSTGTRNNESAKPAKPPETLLREALTAVYPNPEVPMHLTLNFMNTPNRGVLLTASAQVSLDSLVFSNTEGKNRALLDIIGAIYNDQGKPGNSLSDRLTITATPEQSHQPGLAFIYNYEVFVPPGLYQVRIGVRDPASGKVGSVREWVEIPNLAAHQLAMSSLITSERQPQAGPSFTQTAPDGNLAPIRIDRFFHRNSFLRFLVYVYNAAHGSADAQPDVALQIQILRDEQPVVTTPLKKISTEGVTQLDQLPYAADVSLEGLAAGRYVLRVTTIDRVSKSSASQTMRFEIE